MKKKRGSLTQRKRGIVSSALLAQKYWKRGKCSYDSIDIGHMAKKSEELEACIGEASFALTP
jgi:hypothetical protein